MKKTLFDSTLNKQPLFLLLFCCFGCTGSVDDNRDGVVVARVGKHVLSAIEFKAFGGSHQNKERLINMWVRGQLINEYGESSGVGISSLSKTLCNDWVVRGSRILENTVYKNIDVSAVDIRNYYNKNIGAFKRQKDWIRMFSVILETEDEAINAVKTLKNVGRKEHVSLSQNHLSWLALVREGDLMPQLNKTVFNGGTGVVGPTKTRFGFHVAHVVESYPAGSIAGLDEVYDKIASALYLTKRREKYKALIDSLYTNADIYINETLLVGE